MIGIRKAGTQEFRPKPATLARLIDEIPDAIAAMAKDTIKDDLGFGKKNPAARGKQIADALKTIRDVKNKA